MKRLLPALAGLALAAAAFAQQPAPQPRAAAAAPASADEKAVMQIEDELAAAMVKADAAKVDAVLAPSFLFVSPDGMVVERATLLADLKSGKLKFASSKNDEMKVRVFGSAAVAIYRSTDKGTYDGNDISGQYRWTDTFVKEGGKWHIVSTQGTMIPPPMPAMPPGHPPVSNTPPKK